ncbi:MAG: prenyltransferase [Pseudomonadota bacterium]|jgi:1,4-dihydroxy-2-naphthoate octaprenyltransferase
MPSDRLRAWWKASRPPFYIATIIPLLAGWMLAVRDGAPLQVGLFLLINLYSLMVHFATNLANDYFDHFQGADSGESIGGSRMLQAGKITVGELRAALIILYMGAFFLAVGYMTAARMWILSPFVAFSIFSSIFYTAPPFRYGYHGLGEIFAGINMGPVMVLGTYWIMAGNPSIEAIFVSLPIGIMVAGILYYQSIPDMETDRAVGKMTVTVRLGREWSYKILIAQWAVVYLLVIGLIFAGVLSAISLTVLLTSFILIKLLRIMPEVKNWQELDIHGHYVRKLYFLNGVIIVVGIITG